MNAICDHIASHFITQESPANWPRRTLMKWRHRIHEVSHVSRAGNKRFVEDLNSRARMSDGNNPAPLFQLPRELDAAFDLRSNRHHVHRRGVVQHWQTIERVMIGEAAKVLRAQSATLRRVYKGT